MRAVVQRVTEASVRVDGQTVGEIGTGLMVLLGVTHDDTADKAKALAAKIWRLRILREEKSAEDVGGRILVADRPGRPPHPAPSPSRSTPASARNSGLWAPLSPRESSAR